MHSVMASSSLVLPLEFEHNNCDHHKILLNTILFPLVEESDLVELTEFLALRVAVTLSGGGHGFNLDRIGMRWVLKRLWKR